MKALEFIYQETEIHFLVNPSNKDVMINATEMAKIFNRKTEDFLKTKSTKEFIKAIENIINHRLIRGQIIENRGRNGIYFERRLALKFAAWLDVNFELWIYDTIEHVLFSKTERLSETLLLKEEKKKELEAIKTLAYESDNVAAIKIFQLQNEIQKIERLERKENAALKDQLKLNI